MKEKKCRPTFDLNVMVGHSFALLPKVKCTIYLFQAEHWKNIIIIIGIFGKNAGTYRWEHRSCKVNYLAYFKNRILNYNLVCGVYVVFSRLL